MLKPEVSIGVGLATAALVWGTYNHFMPTVVENRALGFNDPHLESTERQASWTAAAIVAGVSIVAKDPVVFILGGAMVIILGWTHKHANMVHPETGSAVPYVTPPQATDASTYTPSELQSVG